MSFTAGSVLPEVGAAQHGGAVLGTSAAAACIARRGGRGRGAFVATEFCCCSGCRSLSTRSSIAYGSVPIYIPVWYPFSYYNVRYGLGTAAGVRGVSGDLASLAAREANAGPMRTAIAACADRRRRCQLHLGLCRGADHAARGADQLARSQLSMEQGLAGVLVQLPPNSTLLMYEAEHAGALRLAGIPLRHVISEAEHPDWEIGAARSRASR